MENTQFSTALNSAFTDSLKQAILETMQPAINVERTGMEKRPIIKAKEAKTAYST